ncbi:multiple monosaccharide ABC transporter ATP-binding protein [Quadrisphaera sp. KR29]|uniref:multiple monosaccharide ABC transporter ATP-binding protein n=1 Tax=Quadrisphaera sp. KR29 TaxID=3461391 RepID=UPI00404407A4
MTTTPAHRGSAGGADTILEMRSITKTFPGVKALSEVSLSVRRGEVHAICGENGAGKSTLMKVLSGVYPHGTYEGDIVFEGQTARFGGITDSEHAGIVIIHQELALVPYLSIAENIFLGNEVKGRGGLIDWNRANGEAAKLLARVGLRENPTTPVGQLGVGKQQLVEIAKALTKDVKLLILDEPTAALNDNDSEHLLGLLRQLQAEGITCIIISHKLNEIISIAQSTTIIRDGRSIETLDIAAGEVTQERIIRGMVGRDLDSRFPERESHPGEEVLRVEDWTVGHPVQDRLVVDGASLSVRAGEVIGIAGLMGAGRTELAMSIFGRSYGRFLGGRLYKRGQEIQARTVSEAIKHGIAYATEDRKKYGLNLIDDIKRNVSAAALDKLSSGIGLVNAHEEIKVAEASRKSMNIKAPTVMALTGKLSGGNQQKVVLSKWIYADPDVLILDEPTRGIDVGAKYEIYVIINKLVAAGKAVIVISSELPELLGTCDRIYTLSQGRITGDVPIREASQERLMELMTQERVPARAGASGAATGGATAPTSGEAPVAPGAPQQSEQSRSPQASQNPEDLA